ncbi:hypothetical protein JW859_14325 [bacterium]|nr:hypothetical protein [bacterium]
MQRCLFLPAAVAFLLLATVAHAATGSLEYRARVVHNNRTQMSFVAGTVDLATGDFSERVEQSYLLDWRTIPGNLEPTRPMLPAIWRSGGQTAQQLGSALPQYNSPLLRHFIVGRVIAATDELAKGEEFLSGQLVVESADYGPRSFEIVATFRGLPLVIVGRHRLDHGVRLAEDLAVLGPSSELYQYFFESIAYSKRPPPEPPRLPEFDPARYVTFPSGGAQPVAIRPVKDWLVFKAQLPNGRPLNLILDSGAGTMVLDELVLKVDALLEPVGKLRVAGAFESDDMNLYEGFSFEVGGVRFDNLQVAGTQLTALGLGADMRIHGIVGGELLQLCQLDIDLDDGLMTLAPPNTGTAAAGTRLPLTFIRDIPHIEAQVQDTGQALLMLDTGQRSALSVNLDWLDHYQLGDELKLNGFLGDISGGLQPRYIIENLNLSLAGRTYRESAADAGLASTFSFNGVPVVGAIGFPLLARHYGGVTFDYTNHLLYLREPADERVFAGRPDAWETPTYPVSPFELARHGEQPTGIRSDQLDDYEYAVALVTDRRPQLLYDRDPLSDDPRSGYSWAKKSDETDALALVRTMQPDLAGIHKDWVGWTASDDPRWQPIELPARSYGRQAESPPVETEPAAEPEPALGLNAPPVEAVLDPASAAPAMEPLLENAAPVLESLSALLNLPRPEAGAPRGPTGPVQPAFRDRLRMHMFLQRLMLSILFNAPRLRLDDAAPESPVAAEEPAREPVYDSGLGGSDKPEGYEFGRGHSRLNFR